MKYNVPVIFLTLLFLLYGPSFTYSQSEVRITRVLSDANGMQLLLKTAIVGESAYFFSNNYLPAVLHMSSRKPLTGKKFKLNLQDSRLYYQDTDNGEMEVITPVKRIEFISGEGKDTNIIFEKGFPSIDKLTPDNFYQVLVSGKASLLMDTKFIVVEHTAYGSAPTKRIDKLVNYYGTSGDTIVKISKGENLFQLFTDKGKELTEYFRRENIKIRKQEDLEKLFKYYNSLHK